MKKKLVNALVLTTAIAAMAGLQVTAAEEEIPYGHFTAE